MELANLLTQDEMWAVLDRDGNPTGEAIAKKEFKLHPEMYRLAANIWIMNSRGEFLIQQRAASLNHKPLYWSMTGGSVIYGETSRQAIVREVKEELGIEIDADECQYILRSPSSRVWIDSFFLKKDIALKDLHPSPEEVACVMWATITHIDHLVKQGKFISARWLFVREQCIALTRGVDITDLWDDKTI